MTYREYYKFPEGTNVGFNYAVTLLDTLKPDELCPGNLNYTYIQTTRTVYRLPDTSLVTTIDNMFSYNSLLEAPYFNTSNVTNMANMFTYCEKLTTIPQYDTSNVTTMQAMFVSCRALESLPALDCGAIRTRNSYPLYSYSKYDKLTDVGGFLNMKMSWDNTQGLQQCPNLSRESCINILNGLYDFTGNGETPTFSQAVLKVHANFLTAVGDDISIGTNKGWTITA